MSVKRTRASGKFRIPNRFGLHARSAAAMVKLANQFRSEIRIHKDNLEVNAKSIMGLMLMAAGKGTTLTIKAQGLDAAEAVAALGGLIDAGFGEE